MYLTAMTQRNRLFDVASRWLRGSVHPSDGRFITKAFLLDHGITIPVLTAFLQDIAQVAPSESVEVVRLSSKDEVRERIISGWNRPTCRARSLFDAYRTQAEDFFPNTPVDVFAVTERGGTLFAMTRLKRITRIADKLARKVASRTAAEINKATLDHHASATLETVGEGGQNTIERLAAHDFRQGRLSFTQADLRIDDVIGTKFIGEPEQLREIERRILQHPLVLSAERSEHHGIYNDVNLVVELACRQPAATIDRLRREDWGAAIERGLEPSALVQDIPDYVESGAGSFSVEIILSTWEDLVESEFGVGLHEERVVYQRTTPLHSGQIATNTSVAITHLLLLAISPTVMVDENPVKIWGRYLPDSLALIVSRLFGIGIGGSPFWVPGMAAASPAGLRTRSPI